MGLVVVVLCAAVAAGLLAGGRPGRLAALRLRSPWLVVAALVAQLVGSLVVDGRGGQLGHAGGLALSALLVSAFLVRNRRLPGGGLLALGLLANALVVGVNGAMPVSPTAASRAGLPVLDLVLDSRHELQTPGTRLRALGDVVPVPLPLRPEVVSPGDVLVAAGLAELVVLGLLGGAAGGAAGTTRPGRPTPRPHLAARPQLAARLR